MVVYRLRRVFLGGIAAYTYGTLWFMELNPTALVVPVFIAGVAMVLAPCGLAVLPVFLSVITGTARQDRAVRGLRREGLLRALLFVATFTALMLILGLGLQQLVFASQLSVRIVSGFAGMLLVLAGLTQIGLKIPLPRHQLSLQKISAASWLMPIAAAAAMGLAWAPCIGPVLGAVLTYASGSGSTGASAMLLASFALGHSLPFLVLALLSDRVVTAIQRQHKAAQIFQRSTGVVLLILGMLLITGGADQLYALMPRTELFLENLL
jgi:cytochrome c-type biogenesis protein